MVRLAEIIPWLEVHAHVHIHMYTHTHRCTFGVQPHSSLVEHFLAVLITYSYKWSVLISKHSHDYVKVHILIKTMFQGAQLLYE